jgi:hypothetical protein
MDRAAKAGYRTSAEMQGLKKKNETLFNYRAG